MTHECLECGEPAKNMHPEYSVGDNGDRLCDGCFIAYWEDKLDEVIESLRDAVETTGEGSVQIAFLDAVEARRG